MTMRTLIEQLEQMAMLEDVAKLVRMTSTIRIAVVKEGQIVGWYRTTKVASRHGKELYSVMIDSLIPGKDPDKISSYVIAKDVPAWNQD